MKLHACPFCGMEARVVTRTWDMFPQSHQAGCINPDCSIQPRSKPCHNKADAVAIWNRRDESK